MTQARPDAYGVLTPSPLDRWIDAMLRLCAELVQNVVRFLGIGRRRRPAECHSDVTPAAMAVEVRNTHQETSTAAPHRDHHDRSPLKAGLAGDSTLELKSADFAVAAVAAAAPVASAAAAAGEAAGVGAAAVSASAGAFV